MQSSWVSPTKILKKEALIRGNVLQDADHDDLTVDGSGGVLKFEE